MATIEAEYLEQLQADPDQVVEVIIKTNDDPAMKADNVSSAGLNVTRTFKLISAIAANGPAEGVIKLASEPWVVSIEPDREVRTM